MGQRGNFVIIENAKAKVYGGNSAATGCIYAFSMGPDYARENAEKYWESDTFYDWGFAEGGYLIDWDSRLAMVFGDPYPSEEIREVDSKIYPNIPEINVAIKTGVRNYLEFISNCWPAWTLVWDYRAVDAFTEYLLKLGVDSFTPLKPNYPRKLPSPVRYVAPRE